MKRYHVKAPLKGIIRSLPGQFVPDQAFVDGMNVVPKRGYIQKATGYTLFSSDTLIGDIMLLCQFKMFDNTKHLLAFTTDKAYQWTGATWSNITKQDAGIDVNFTGTIKHLFSAEVFTNWLIVTNGIDPIQRWTGSGLMADLGGSPPTSKLIKGYYNHLILANTVEDGNPYPQRLRWSELGNPEIWPSENYVDITHTPGWIMGLEPLQRQLVVYKDDSIYLVSYVGPPMYFRVTPVVVAADKGLLAPRAVARVGNRHYYLGKEDVCVFDGIQSTPIGKKNIDLYTVLDPVNQETSIAFAVEDEVWFVVPTNKSDAAMPDTAYVYDTLTGAWGKRELPANCFVEYFLEETFTIDEMDKPIDSYDMPFDYRKLVKTAPDILMGSGSKVYKVDNSTSFDGAAIDGWAQTKLFDFGSNRKKRLLRVGFETEQYGDYNMQVWVGTADSPASSIDAWYGPYDFNLDKDYWIDVDHTDRCFALRFGTNAADTPFEIQGYWFEYIEGGYR